MPAPDDAVFALVVAVVDTVSLGAVFFGAVVGLVPRTAGGSTAGSSPLAQSSHWGCRGGSSNQIGATTSGRRARHSAVRIGHGRNWPTPLPLGVAMNL